MRATSPLIAVVFGLPLLVSAARLVQRADVLDTCAYLNTDVISSYYNFGHINQVLCMSTISSTPIARLIDNVGGSSVTTFTKLINASGGKQCNFPAHSIPAGTTSDACAFTCTDGYSLSANKKSCVCGAGKVVCNGMCQLGAICPTAAPIKYKREQQIKRAAEHCPPNYDVCAISSGRPGVMGAAWECVDGQTDLESCGGCIHPFNDQPTFYGVDCTAIEGVSDVSCQQGVCNVERCNAGFRPSLDRRSCESVLRAGQARMQAPAHSLRNATRIV